MEIYLLLGMAYAAANIWVAETSKDKGKIEERIHIRILLADLGLVTTPAVASLVAAISYFIGFLLMTVFWPLFLIKRVVW